VASPNLASSPSEIFNILLFFWLLLKLGVLTGLIMVPLALNWKRILEARAPEKVIRSGELENIRSSRLLRPGVAHWQEKGFKSDGF
jgi:hypothetical protein